MDEEDPLRNLTPGQRARSHVLVARKLLDELEGFTGSKFTVDQVLAAAQIHALLAIANAIGDPDGRG